ncbi:MAG TPA: aspartate kinase [Acidimicrobiia bacterium]|nr:aspartate kinase [Acidimicrobiia bacterium]
MALVVQKYGGTSVGDPSRIRAVADRVARRRQSGDSVVVIVSAMGHSTDELIRMAREVTANHHPREMDMLLTAGERISMALLAMAIRDHGVEAMSLTGSQAGILTDMIHGQARIRDIRAFRVEEGLADGKVVIVAGFQGVNPDTKEITTLGRGGSDATAVAMAAALGADACEIYTDVDGVFTADPRVVAEARKLDEVGYEEMLELASSGARVLMERSVEFGRRYGVPIHVRSSFHEGSGTWVKESTVEQASVVGIAHDSEIAELTVRSVPDVPGMAAALFGTLAEARVPVDLILQSAPQSGVADISFTVPIDRMPEARSVVEADASRIGAGSVDVETGIGRVSVIGSGLAAHTGFAARMFSVLADAGIDIRSISTSPIRVTCVIDEEHVEKAVQRLHQAFDPPDGPVAS